MKTKNLKEYSGAHPNRSGDQPILFLIIFYYKSGFINLYVTYSIIYIVYIVIANINKRLFQ